MRFYTKTHKHYCGIDLHARTMYVCTSALARSDPGVSSRRDTRQTVPPVGRNRRKRPQLRA